MSLTLLICIGLIYEIHSLEYQQMLGSAHAVAEHCCSHWLLVVFEIPQAVHQGGVTAWAPQLPLGALPPLHFWAMQQAGS